eukprot:s386_g22.t1
MHEVKVAHHDIYRVCAQAGLGFADPASPPLVAGSSSFPCHLCAREFSSVQGLQAHRWKAHGLISEERKYIYDSTCRACNVCFWTVQRLQQHLHWSRRHVNGCFHVLQRDFVPVDAPVSCSVPPGLQQIHRLPACPVAGPAPPPRPPAWERIRDSQLAELRLVWQSTGLPDVLPFECQQAVFAACDQLLQQWTSPGVFVPSDDSLIDQWTRLLESLSDDSDPDSVHVWAFLQWGRTNLLIAPPALDVDAAVSRIASTFAEFAVCFPLWDLLQRFDICAHMTAPA